MVDDYLVDVFNGLNTLEHVVSFYRKEQNKLLKNENISKTLLETKLKELDDLDIYFQEVVKESKLKGTKYLKQINMNVNEIKQNLSTNIQEGLQDLFQTLTLSYQTLDVSKIGFKISNIALIHYGTMAKYKEILEKKLK